MIWRGCLLHARLMDTFPALTLNMFQIVIYDVAIICISDCLYLSTVPGNSQAFLIVTEAVGMSGFEYDLLHSRDI